MADSHQSKTREIQTREGEDKLSSVYRSAIRMLQVGFWIAVSLFVAGIIWSAIEREPLTETVEPIQDLPGLIRDGHPAAVIDLAILTLMLTPVATVLAVAIAFVRMGDQRYGVISLFVLIVLLLSIGLALV